MLVEPGSADWFERVVEMRWLVRAIAIWTIISGLLAFALVATHFGVIGDDLGEPRRGAQQVVTAAILGACAVLGALMLYSGVELWRLRDRGRRLVLWISVALTLLMLASLIGDLSSPVVPPLLINAIVLFILVTPSARALCGPLPAVEGP